MNIYKKEKAQLWIKKIGLYNKSFLNQLLVVCFTLKLNYKIVFDVVINFLGAYCIPFLKENKNDKIILFILFIFFPQIFELCVYTRRYKIQGTYNIDENWGD